MYQLTSWKTELGFKKYEVQGGGGGSSGDLRMGTAEEQYTVPRGEEGNILGLLSGKLWHGRSERSPWC